MATRLPKVAYSSSDGDKLYQCSIANSQKLWKARQDINVNEVSSATGNLVKMILW